MCGICGFVKLKSDKLNREHLLRMNDTITHRGPDEGGDFEHKNVFLAMRRLSIIDLAQGHQPMFSPDNQLCVVFNGEIYNYKELKAELEQAGYQFATESDTETLLHGYQAWGIEGLLSRLNGMFGACLYDMTNQLLYLFRDRAGEKPIYYYADPNYFIFGSELKVLTHTHSIPCQIDEAELAKYLMFQFTPGDKTLLKNVFKLPAGSFLRMDVKTLDFKIEPYWKIHFSEAPPNQSFDDYKAQLVELLRDSVKIRLRADVPVGAFLSGGLDSSINVALISDLGISDLNTFSIGFEHQDFDESPYSRQVAEHFGTKHHHFLLNPNELATLLPRVLEMVDEPVADAACIPTYWLCLESRKRVKVALTGEGADELFAGYEYYKHLPPVTHSPTTSWWQQIKGRLMGQPTFELAGQPDTISGFPLMVPASTAVQLIQSDVSPESLIAPIHQATFATTGIASNRFLTKAQYLDIKTWLAHDLLMKVDKMSMANSLEVRAPFLDHRLIEFSFMLPDAYKIQGGAVKHVLRESFRKALPDIILDRQKHGFNLPMHQWLRKELKELVHDTLSPQAIQTGGILNAKTVGTVLTQFMEHQVACERLVFSLFVFQHWWNSLK